MYTDKPLVLCSPTGSGKTAVFEMAIVRLMTRSSSSLNSSFKIVYSKFKLFEIHEIVKVLTVVCTFKDTSEAPWHSGRLECRALEREILGTVPILMTETNQNFGQYIFIKNTSVSILLMFVLAKNHHHNIINCNFYVQYKLNLANASVGFYSFQGLVESYSI